MLLASLGLVSTSLFAPSSNFAPSSSSLLRAQQRLGNALDRVADAALAPAPNMLQADAPPQQRSISVEEAAHSEEEERAQLPTSLVPSRRAGRQSSGTGSGRHVNYRRDMLTRKAIPARPSVAERLEAQTNATLRPAIQEQPQRQPKRVPNQLFRIFAPLVEYEKDESSTGRAPRRLLTRPRRRIEW